MLTAFLAGLLFGAGLILSGMADPANVLGFLDVTGEWNPSLAFVMAGGLGVTMLGYGLIAKRPPASAQANLDARLIGGSALFGLGWGVGGYCPGPALAAAGGGFTEALLFTAAMIAGVLAWKLVAWRMATCPILAARR